MTGHGNANRREFLAGALSLGAAMALSDESTQASTAPDPAEPHAHVAITLDLEMCRHYPTWEQTHWDYEKGNLDADTKRYAVEAARRVKAKGGRIHFFAVGRVFEQEDVSWLEEIVKEGHYVGNHTYDHVNVRAKTPSETQFRFQRAPWLVEGKSAFEIIEGNIRLATLAMKQRLGIAPQGFRTPGGFYDGIVEFPEIQKLLLRLGFDWVSSKYPKHPQAEPGKAPSKEVIAGIVQAQADAQPFAYQSGLVEVPMNPISDVNAFRTGKWPRPAFLDAVHQGLSWAIDRGATYDFLGHPSCLVVTDPDFQVIDLICDLVEQSKGRASLVDLGTMARRVKRPVS
ncbi:polysaccharide deacetylase family protein [Singulisphaera sp. PoT]|uniref:polysaccharide deacetylase family protein n=1 Tax=Singulisphaera sp. PoT TaxID=3411797 RepID=UPI003BF46C92